MIKLIAAITMLIDHIGALLLYDNYKLRIYYELCRMIGRISLPLFAFCIARGFYFSEKHGTTFKYIKNLTIISLITQTIFTFMSYFLYGQFEWSKVNLNICFAWLISVIILKLISSIKDIKEQKSIISIVAIIALCVIASVVPIEYNLYAVVYPIIFYYTLIKIENPLFCFLLNVLNYFLYTIIEKIPVFANTTNQIVAIFALFIVILIKPKTDKLIKMPKKFFYWFYPAQFYVLCFIKWYFFLRTKL